MVEEFDLNHDATLIDQQKKIVEIHVADGKNDALQQIEHGLLNVLGGYKAMGRLYRGIIEPTIRQYVLLGDAMVQTDNLPYDPALKDGEVKNGKSGSADDRWVFTENNPERELHAAGGLAAAARVLKTYNPTMAKEALDAAKHIYRIAAPNTKKQDVRVNALAELILATNDDSYREELIGLQPEIVSDIAKTGWAIGRVMPSISDAQFAGTDSYVNALNFILGVHPGENTQSFASGVGANSALVAYGVNRADWSYIPGGVISGTALIRPDLPELKIWPYFWQQTEYVMGGGEANYMFLALAVDKLNNSKKQ